MCHVFGLRSLRHDWRAIVVLAALASVGAGAVFSARPANAQYAFADFAGATEPSIIVPRLMVRVQRFTRYRPDPRKEPVYGQWSWCPRIEFGLRGPIPGGAQCSVVVSKPNGQTWLTLPLQTPELAAGAWQTVRTEDQDESKAITASGTCSFSIVLNNPLTNGRQVLYSGRFEVSKYKAPLEKTAGATEFYVNHDWLLSTGLLEINRDADDEAPSLTTYFWFKGDESSNNPEAYVFYNGKQIYGTKSEGQGRGIADVTLTTPGVDKDKTWFRWKFDFGGVRVYRREKDQSANNYTQFFLDKNPGNYEVKVLRAGKLSRVMKFTVGADGKIVDNGIAKASHMGTTQMFMPVEALPGSDAAYSAALLPTSFYGNAPKTK